MLAIGHFLIAIAALFPSQHPAKSDLQASIEIEVLIPGREGRILAGTLTLPSVGKPPFPAAVSLTGSGSHLRDGNRTSDHPYRPFREIARSLAAQGVAMLRLDDRGTGQSTGDAAAATGDDIADDTHVAIRWLRSRADIESTRIALIGHSFGGAVAPLVAVQDPGIAAVALMGAPAGSFRETMRYQHRYNIENDPAIKPEDRDKELNRRMVQQERNVAQGTQDWRTWSQDRDPLPTARRVRCPVLILQGLTDRAVAPDEARTLAMSMREAGNGDVTLRLFDGLNHHFNKDPVGATDGYDRLPSQTLAPEFLQAISSWLAKTLASGRGYHFPGRKDSARARDSHG